MPTISVIMPVYNSEKYLSEAIDSILKQSYKDFELIMIDDASTDASWDIARRQTDPRIVLLKNETNLGVAATLNRGLQHATGQYIARMDADDISHPLRFEKQLRYLEKHPDVGVLGTGIKYIGTKQGIHINHLKQEENRVHLLFSSCIAHPSVMLRRAVLNDSPYEPAYDGREDYVLWWKLSLKTGIANLPDILLQYRIHPTQATQTANPATEHQRLTFKQRQLSDLGIKASESMLQAFYHLYSSGRLDTATEILNLSALFEEIERTNAHSGHFPAHALQRTFRGIINAQSARLNIRPALCVARRSAYASLLGILKIKMRKLLAQ